MEERDGEGEREERKRDGEREKGREREGGREERERDGEREKREREEMVLHCVCVCLCMYVGEGKGRQGRSRRGMFLPRWPAKVQIVSFRKDDGVCNGSIHVRIIHTYVYAQNFLMCSPRNWKTENLVSVTSILGT